MRQGSPPWLAALHARVFTVPRPFTEAEFRDLLIAPAVFLCDNPQGFALGRVLAGEAELLTLAVAPAHRRMGHGLALLEHYHQQALKRGALEAFLEVDAENTAAIQLYHSTGYIEAGLRKGYYRYPDGRATDALILRKTL